MDSKIKAKLIQFLENGQVELALSFLREIKATNSPRTPKQNAALHLWFNLIEREAENQGVTQNMLIKHTSQLRVTAEWMKSNVKQLIKALWGYESTTQIKKTGEIDIVIDHVTDWLSKEMEVPAFPCDNQKQLENLGGYKTRAGMGTEGVDYPEYNGEVKL